MQRTSCQYPASVLNNMMAKIKITPIYELISHEAIQGVHVMRVTCPISAGGIPLSAEGWAGSKKAAKHNAALTFMETHLNSEKNKQLTKARTDSNSAVNAHGTDVYSEGQYILKAICLSKNLGQPEVEDVCIAGRSDASTFMAECRVSDLCIRGKGKSKMEARIHATTRMIQMLMETASIHEIFKSPQYSNEIVSSKDNPNDSQLPVQNGVNSKRTSDVRSPEKPEEKIKVHTHPDTTETLIELRNARKKAGRIGDSNNNLASNVNLLHVADNSQHETFSTEHSSTLPKNSISKCVKSRVVTTTSGGVQKNWTRLQAVSQIERTLVNLEKPLCDKILKALTYSNLSHHQTVPIFSHNYQVFIHQCSPPKVFEDNEECTDQSIRVACLTKLLMDLKEHIANYNGKIDKQL